MKRQITIQKHIWLAGAAVIALTLSFAVGCKQHQTAQQAVARTDQQVSSDIQARIQGESALAGQNIQVSVADGVATLTGSVSDDASRALAGNDSGTVDGVKTVVNNLTVQPAKRTLAEAPPARGKRPKRDERANMEMAAATTPPTPTPDPTPAPVQTPAPPPQAQEPPKPVVKQVTLDAGTIVPVRITDVLDSKTAAPNQTFHASLAGDLMVQGVVAIPHGSPVLGRVVDAREAAHFKGNSLLSIELTQLSARGRKFTLVTDAYSKQGSGRGKNTAEKTGGGALLGTLVGALAGGGKGAAIGGLAGAGAGAGVNAATRGQEVQIPSETLINFRLQSPITVTVTISPSESRLDQDNGDPQLQHR